MLADVHAGQDGDRDSPRRDAPEALCCAAGAMGVSRDPRTLATRSSDAEAPVRYLTCPRCRLSIRPRALSLQLVHCPRCVARTRTLVELFASTLPAERLYSSEDADDR